MCKGALSHNFEFRIDRVLLSILMFASAAMIASG